MVSTGSEPKGCFQLVCTPSNWPLFYSPFYVSPPCLCNYQLFIKIWLSLFLLHFEAKRDEWKQTSFLVSLQDNVVLKQDWWWFQRSSRECRGGGCRRPNKGFIFQQVYQKKRLQSWVTFFFLLWIPPICKILKNILESSLSFFGTALRLHLQHRQWDWSSLKPECSGSIFSKPEQQVKMQQLLLEVELHERFQGDVSAHVL